ncbi:uncharacterized protein [Euwallacea fornicatus]|uniref:uncharacterized protein n=1 Tax=Euwallacea fornicatus TaxID=995702 RepID=UPI00338E7658
MYSVLRNKSANCLLGVPVTKMRNQVHANMGPLSLSVLNTGSVKYIKGKNYVSNSASDVPHWTHQLGDGVLSCSPYSPDLASSDYHLFLSLQNFLDGKIFYTEYDANNA